jgi:hypothetical protein
MSAYTDSEKGLISFFLPFVRNTDDRVRALVIFEDADEFCETTTITGGHAVDFVEDDSHGAMTFGSEKVAHVRGIQERFDKVGHGGFVSELTGVTFDGSESGIVDDAVGQSGFADAWWTVEEHGFAGRR